jgi:dephospho-CoA kinase
MKTIKPELIKLSPEERLYHYKKPLIGLSGGIATGKSSVSKLLEERGIKIIDADQLVKSIYAKAGTKKFILDNYPQAWEKDSINFTKLRELFFSDASIKAAIEAFIYARLPEAFKEAADKISDQQFYFYDVPLLFEKQLESKVDLSVVVYASRQEQLSRLVKRDGTNVLVANQILEQQMNIEDKKKKADMVIINTGTINELAAEVDRFLLQVLN